MLVERGSYLLELYRYIALNPVRAKIVKLPEDYIWSSHRATAGQEEPLSSLNLSWILSNFSPDSSNAAAMYQKFVMEGTGKAIVIPGNGIEDIKCRNLAIYQAYVEHAYTQREIAAYLGISYVTVSRIIKEIKC